MSENDSLAWKVELRTGGRLTLWLDGRGAAPLSPADTRFVSSIVDRMQAYTLHRDLYPEGDMTARDVSPYRERSTAAMADYLRQPCEATARLLLSSIMAWPAVDTWQHIGTVRAVYEEISRFVPIRLALRLATLISLFRDRRAGTWNDYYLIRWKFARSNCAPILKELHRRIHQRGAKWVQVSNTMLWAVESLRATDPEFRRQWSDYVRSLPCSLCSRES